MVFRLITPKFLCSISVEYEVGKGFVVREDFIVLSVEHGMKTLLAISVFENAGLFSLSSGGKRSSATRDVDVRSVVQRKVCKI